MPRQSASIAACFPGAVVLEPRRLGAALEVVLRRLRLREQAAHRLELLRTMEVRGARDRDLGSRRDRAAPGSSGSAWIGFAELRK